MDEAWWQVESHFILCTLCCLSRVCHIIKETFILQFSLDYMQVDVKNKKLRKWKLKNFIKLISAINYKIYVFKGDIHKTLVNVVPSQNKSKAHEKCLMSRTWTENEWKFNGIYIITAVLHCLPFHAFSSFFCLHFLPFLTHPFLISHPQKGIKKTTTAVNAHCFHKTLHTHLWDME